MKKKRKNYVIISVIGLIMVVLIILLLNDRGMGTKVITASCKIVKGTIIDDSNYSMMFEEKNIPQSMVTDDTVIDKNTLIGRKIIVDIEKNTVIQNAFAEPGDYSIDTMENPVTLGLRVSDISQIACGIIRRRDRIDISVIDSQAEECIDVLRNVYVSGCYNTDGTEITDGEGCASYINVVVEKEDEQLINEKLAAGELRVCKVGG